eukprot:GHVS01054376.1.p1 GENE.GHVS01054376.1~~GHVS01054376.1.p1  ORF type:complete len:600 (+),score=68.96 GHVS01054376.1:111-1910(+)
MFGLPEVDVGGTVGRSGGDGWKTLFIIANGGNSSQVDHRQHGTSRTVVNSAHSSSNSVGPHSSQRTAPRHISSTHNSSYKRPALSDNASSSRTFSTGPLPSSASQTEPFQVKMSPGSKMQDLLEKAAQLLNLAQARRVFTSDGHELFGMDQIPDEEVLYVSEGEEFDKAAHTEESVVGGYILKRKLGEGGFGKVMQGVHVETGEVVAVKFISKRSFKEVTDADRVFVEIQALRDLSHKSVIKMFDVIDHPHYICFIMEYASNGELRELVSQRDILPEEEARTFFEQIVKGVHYCHSKNIVHRDLKLENILLDAQFRCKIADFGLSDFVADSSRTVTEGGTEAYLAPEVWNGTSQQSNPFKIDVWALGVILYAMTHGRLPFQKPDKETVDHIQKHGIQFGERCSPALRKAITSMLTPEPNRRVSVNEVMNDKWLRHSMPWQKQLSLSEEHLKVPLSTDQTFGDTNSEKLNPNDEKQEPQLSSIPCTQNRESLQTPAKELSPVQPGSLTKQRSPPAGAASASTHHLTEERLSQNRRAYTESAHAQRPSLPNCPSSGAPANASGASPAPFARTLGTPRQRAALRTPSPITNGGPTVREAHRR